MSEEIKSQPEPSPEELIARLHAARVEVQKAIAKAKSERERAPDA